MIAGGRHRVATVCRVLGVARSNVIERRSRGSTWRDRRGRRPVDDPELIRQLRDLAAQRPTYGYRRLWALLRRLRAVRGQGPVNAKRVYRLAKAHQLLLQRHTGAPSLGLAHEGVIAVERSDQRYCSDGFEIRCDNGERVRVVFSLDCCDRQAIAFAATTAGISGELIRDVMVQTLVERFGRDPMSGALFGFINARRDKLKLLVWERGVWAHIPSDAGRGFRRMSAPPKVSRRLWITPGNHPLSCRLYPARKTTADGSRKVTHAQDSPTATTQI